MKLFPAVDILDNNSVRLLYGDRSKVTIYGNPIDIALKWQDEGADILHIVDLNGAFDDSRVNEKIIKQLVSEVKIPIQLGGGIKSTDKVKYCFEELGVERVIVGTAIVKTPQILTQACALYGTRIVAGIDAKDAKVAVKGWVESVNLTPLDIALRAKREGVKDVVYTDISRDGALSGVNVDATIELQKESGLNIIASGGVSSIEDVKTLNKKGAYGVILGRALYTGDLSLAEAKRFLEGEKCFAKE